MRHMLSVLVNAEWASLVGKVAEQSNDIRVDLRSSMHAIAQPTVIDRVSFWTYGERSRRCPTVVDLPYIYLIFGYSNTTS